jgi:carboxypeptidase C (cathepsin A)
VGHARRSLAFCNILRSYLFMQGFYQKFPQLAANDFWITGESYGGHYVPNAAARIIRGNEQKQGIHINLKGFMVGNAWTDSTIDNRGAVDYWFQHGTYCHRRRLASLW